VENLRVVRSDACFMDYEASDIATEC